MTKITLGLGAAASLMLSACSVSIPLGSLVDTETVTQSIPAAAERPTVGKPPGKSAPRILPGDISEAANAPAAQFALALALEVNPPQSQFWSDAALGAAGRFIAAPLEGAAAEQSCRRVLADFETVAGPLPMEGVACRSPEGIWELARLAPRA